MHPAIQGLIAQQDFEQAWALCQDALRRDPDSTWLLVTAGGILMRLEQYAAAERHLARLTELRPESAIAWDNLGCCLRDRNRLPEAMACFDRALALNPKSARAHYDRALCLLAAGDYPAGFAEYEHRWQAAQIELPEERNPNLRANRWRGEDIAGRRILLYGEQGFGDTIQFLRYAPLVAARGAHPVLAVPSPVRGLAACLQPQCEVGADGGPWQFDVHCPLLALPGVFGTTLDTVPPPAVFSLPEDACRRWRARIPRDGRLNVGLAWAGNPQNPIDYRRSTHLRTLAPLFGNQRLRLFGFQVGPRAEETAAVDPAALTGLAPELTTLTETAAALLQMDLVVTVESLIAHLAGSLGLETWILLPSAPDWRWLLGRDDSPWYPPARLFRQTVPGDWSHPVARVCAALRDVDGPVRPARRPGTPPACGAI